MQIALNSAWASPCKAHYSNMLTLSNRSLTVTILDPRQQPQQRLGPRFCSGGHVVRIVDNSRGGADLLTASDPTTSVVVQQPDRWRAGSEGLPDSFAHRPLHNPPTGVFSDDTRGLVIGAGIVDTRGAVSFHTVRPAPPTAPPEPSLLEPCQWEVEPFTLPGEPPEAVTGLHFRTSQKHGGWALELLRTVTLINRTVRVNTILTNTGDQRIPLVWHPHPFYPWPSGTMLFSTNLELDVQQGEGFSIDAITGTLRREKANPSMVFLSHKPANDAPLIVSNQRHPVVESGVSAQLSYIPTFFPVWGNEATVSWEPYYERTLQMGIPEQWAIDYHFGDDAPTTARL